jgi:hypothetical protein
MRGLHSSNDNGRGWIRMQHFIASRSAATSCVKRVTIELGRGGGGLNILVRARRDGGGCIGKNDRSTPVSHAAFQLEHIAIPTELHAICFERLAARGGRGRGLDLISEHGRVACSAKIHSSSCPFVYPLTFLVLISRIYRRYNFNPPDPHNGAVVAMSRST